MHNYASTIVSILGECDVSRNHMSKYKQLQLYYYKLQQLLELHHASKNCGNLYFAPCLSNRDGDNNIICCKYRLLLYSIYHYIRPYIS